MDEKAINFYNLTKGYLLKIYAQITKLTEENFEKTCCVLAVIQTTNFTGGIKKMTPTHYDVKKQKKR